VEIRSLTPSELDLVAPVWASLLEHHGEVEPDLRTRPAAESWPMRRSEYESWLAHPDSFAVVAEEDGEPVGYAVAHVRGPDETWVTGERTAELETLAVLPGHRGTGIGGALMDAVEEELGRLGVEDMWVAVVAANTDALRFYERRGLRSYMHRMHTRLRVGRDG
jgi:GNAT superfamily N-acetyltransferase